MKKKLCGKSLWTYICDKDTMTKSEDAKTDESKTIIEAWEVNYQKLLHRLISLLLTLLVLS